METESVSIAELPVSQEHKAANPRLASQFKTVIKRLYRFFESLYVLTGLHLLLINVKHSQPLYGFNTLKTKLLQRTCIDRADRINQQIVSWGRGGHILDIGCSLGYFSHYFADRGYQVEGIDIDPKRIAICKLLQRLHGKKTHFTVAEFSPEFVERIATNQYNISFLFNIIHLVISTKGLDYAQTLVARLVEKTSVLFIELALKQEQTAGSMQQCLPDDELAIFAKCTGVTIEKMGFFPDYTHSAWRPLYMVKKNTLELGGETLPIYARQFTSHYGSGYRGRHYYDCGDKYLKKYILPQRNNDLEQILREIDNYQRLPANNFLPKLLMHQQHSNSIEMLFTKLPGDNLHNILAKGESVPILPVVTGIIQGLDFLFKHDLYHNDLRLWNAMFDGKQTYLFDLGLACEKETESTSIALLWIIDQLHQLNHCRFKHPITEQPKLNKDSFSPEIKEIVKSLQETSSCAEFLQWFKNQPLPLF